MPSLSDKGRVARAFVFSYALGGEMQKTKIEWTDYTWNPIKGLCPVGCWYCYAWRIYKRFGLDIDLRIKEISRVPAKPSRIFVCSTIELFDPGIPKRWRDIIFEFIKDCPQHTFQILTKFPWNIDREMPDNVWLGTTVTVANDVGWRRIYELSEAKARVKFISFEPLMGSLSIPFISSAEIFDWFIFGRLTGYGKRHTPKKDWIESPITFLRAFKKPVFIKNNLKEIWGEPLYQEFPK